MAEYLPAVPAAAATNRHHADPVIKVARNVPLVTAASRLRFVAAIRRTSTFSVRDPPPFELAFLQHTQQFRLKGRRNVADLVQKKRAPIRQFEAALTLHTAPVKAPFSCPNNSDSPARFPAERRSSA